MALQINGTADNGMPYDPRRAPRRDPAMKTPRKHTAVGQQLLQSVREMNAGKVGRVYRVKAGSRKLLALQRRALLSCVPKAKRRRVDSARNSTSVFPFDELDWRYWWTDMSFKSHYLHVRHKDGERVSRVRCKLSKRPRLWMQDGKLYWLIP